MNTLWLKIASVVIGILILIVLLPILMPGGDKEPEQVNEPNAPTSSFWGQVEDDRENFLSTPEPAEITDANSNETEEITDEAPVEFQPVVPVQPQKREVTIYVKQLSDIEDIEAERLINAAVPGFDIGRLPVTGYSLMMQTCRQIISRWPDSSYAFQCKRMYAALPERYQQRYNITANDMDISMFFQPRAGTAPVTVTIEGQ